MGGWNMVAEAIWWLGGVDILKKQCHSEPECGNKIHRSGVDKGLEKILFSLNSHDYGPTLFPAAFSIKAIVGKRWYELKKMKTGVCSLNPAQ